MDPYEVLCIEKTASEEEIKNKFKDMIEEYTKTQDKMAKQKIQTLKVAYDLLINGNSYKEIRELIEKNNFIDAEVRLNVIDNANSAEWNYLQGFLAVQKEWYDSGLNYLKKSVELDPNNVEYLNSLNKLQTRVIDYVTKYAKQNVKPNSNNINACGGGNNSSGNGGMC
ncbi:MAG: J domain-containing protein [Clostridium sp.]|uniref:J domain-containing protein n=1 Tax=Clostridium sp. TaxID=1506 RepID=UPI0025BC3439|nr:J domain-containing protein [Clostridium sp.]MCE5220573.1 J domain-containing protein [Clostridium sp.]